MKGKLLVILGCSLALLIAGCGASNPVHNRPVQRKPPTRYVQIPEDVGHCRYANNCRKSSGKPKTSAHKSSSRKAVSAAKPVPVTNMTTPRKSKNKRSSSSKPSFDVDKAIEQLKNM